MKGLHKQTTNPKKDALSWMKEDEVARGRKEEIKATTVIILRLIDYMERRQMTQTDLARVLGVTPQYINKLLHGQDNSFRIETAIEYGNKLGIKLVEVPPSDKEVDYEYFLWSKPFMYVSGVDKVVFEEDFLAPVFSSDILRTNKKTKWKAINQLVIA